MATVTGGSGRDTLGYGRATEGDDGIWGLGGADLINGLGDNDYIRGGEGADVIIGGAGINTAAYDNSASGVVVSLKTGHGYGGTAEGDRLYMIQNLGGSWWSDVLWGDDGINVLDGDRGADTLKGGGGGDHLYGGYGNDWLEGGEGGDWHYGGDGLDTVGYSDSTIGVWVSLLEDAGAGGALGDHFNSIECVSGSNHGDEIRGDNSSNRIEGWDGNDFLWGMGGYDTLVGGRGNDQLFGDFGVTTDSFSDVMVGGLDNDTYYVNHAGDVVYEYAGEGQDTVFTSLASYTLADNVEKLYAEDSLGTAAIMLVGNGLGNSIAGNNGENSINGGAGADFMSGYGGNDIYTVDMVGSTGDWVLEFAGQGTDTVYALVDGYVLADNVEILSLNTGSATSGTGNALANELYGNMGNNTLNGGDGRDDLNGLGGAASHDAFVFRVNEADNDRVYDFEGNGAGAGDVIRLEGFGAGTTITDWGAESVWQINAAGGHIEYVTIYGSFNPATDVVFA